LEYPRIQAAGILGVAAGTGVGLLLARDPPAARDVLASDLATFVGAQMGAGLGDLLDLSLPEDRNLRAPLSLGGGAALLGASLLASRSGLTLPDPLTTWIDLGHGAWIGAWAPLLFSDHPEESQVGGGLRMGLGAGYLAAVALSPHVESSPRSASLQVGGMLAGNALGAGIPLALGAQEPARLVVGPMLAGGIGWGVFGAHVSEGKDTVPVGYALTAGGAGTLIAAGLAPFVELEPSESVLVASAGAWGSWYGAWAGTLFDLPSDAHWGLTLGAGNAFLVGSSLLVATSWHPTWGDVLRIDGLGLLGGSMGALAGVITSPDLDAVALGSLLGSTAGLAAGALLPGDGRARRTSGGGVLGILPEFALPFSTHVSASPWVDVEGRPGAWLQLDVTPGA
jgi:hypothetical protein